MPHFESSPRLKSTNSALCTLYRMTSGPVRLSDCGEEPRLMSSLLCCSALNLKFGLVFEVKDENVKNNEKAIPRDEQVFMVEMDGAFHLPINESNY